MKASIAALLFSLPFLALAGGSGTSVSVKSCWSIENRAGQVGCLAELSDELDSKLERLREQRTGLVYNKGLEAQISAAEAAWEKLRHRECLVVSDQFESASLQAAKVFECKIYFAAKRIESQQLFIGCSENGCPWFF